MVVAGTVCSLTLSEKMLSSGFDQKEGCLSQQRNVVSILNADNANAAGN
jgi:hypothetical protein